VSAVIVISFDIDGTLEIGEPPGVVPIALIRTAKRRGYLVGSCSDRPLTYQQAVWERLGMTPDFMVLKHRLTEVRRRFAAAAYYHVGDSDIDARYAHAAGFRFLEADPVAHAAWVVELFGPSG
jgi:phosphoglycolate phosphatase-like HAD superfamily hydrolase